MFLVRRRSDGKYWRNLSYHSRWGKPHWADSPEGIRPFKNRSGAKNAMGGFCYVKGEYVDHLWGDKYTYDPALFDQKFEIVEVEVRLK